MNPSANIPQFSISQRRGGGDDTNGSSSSDYSLRPRFAAAAAAAAPSTPSTPSTTESYLQRYLRLNNMSPEPPTPVATQTTPTDLPKETTPIPVDQELTKPTMKTVDENELRESIELFSRRVHPKIYILTPCYGGMCHTEYTSCLIRTLNFFTAYGISIQVEFCPNDSLVPRARNNLVARAMNDPEMTHIMFIDSDIVWSPFDVLRLLLSEKDLCGGAYPIKNYFWRRLIEDPLNPYATGIVDQWIAAKKESTFAPFLTDEDMVRSRLLRYNANFNSEVLSVKDNFAEVKHLATGFMMIRRPVIEQLINSYPETYYIDDVAFSRPGEEQFSYALFDTFVKDKHILSEDWAFCERWKAIGGKVYMDISVQLGHIGSETFRGSVIATCIM